MVNVNFATYGCISVNMPLFSLLAALYGKFPMQNAVPPDYVEKWIIKLFKMNLIHFCTTYIYNQMRLMFCNSDINVSYCITNSIWIQFLNTCINYKWKCFALHCVRRTLVWFKKTCASGVCLQFGSFTVQT